MVFDKTTMNEGLKSYYIDVVNDTNVEMLAQKGIEEQNKSENYDDSFYVCDVGDIYNKHKLWMECFPDVRPHFAVKCNPDPVLLKLLIGLGAGFDCASKTEIQTILDLGGSAKDIIFANPCKQSSHIKYARNVGVDLLVFDSEEELYKIKRLFPFSKLVLRIQTDDSAAICRFSMKFGANVLSCPKLLDKAKELELDVVGVSFHVGSGCQDPKAYVDALKSSQSVFDYAASIGYNFNLLDIGGGFSGSLSQINFFRKMSAVINNTLNDLFPKTMWPDLKLIAEPGRYYAASAFTLVTNIIARKDVARDIQVYEDDNAETTGAVLNSVLPGNCDEPAYMYFLNDGLYGSFNCLFFDHAIVTPTVFQVNEEVGTYSSSIWGPTCDGLDKVMDCCLLPELNVGDWLLWKEMGAYTVSAASSFNGFKTKRIRYVISKMDFKSLKISCTGGIVDGNLQTIDGVEKLKSPSSINLCEGLLFFLNC